MRLHVVDRLHCFVNLVVQALVRMNNRVTTVTMSPFFSSYLDLLLRSSGKEKGVHLSLQGVVHLDVNVIARSLLLFRSS